MSARISAAATQIGILESGPGRTEAVEEKSLQRNIRNVDAENRIINSERDAVMSPGAVQVWFHRPNDALGFKGASGHRVIRRDAGSA